MQQFEQVACGGLPHGTDHDKRNSGEQLRSEEVNKALKHAEAALSPANM